MEDPITKRKQPRNYIEALEQRVAQLENTLTRQQRQQVASPQDSDVPAPEASSHGLQQSEPVGDTDPADTFASRVATLGFNAAGAEPRYLGSSSVFSFSRIISSSLLNAAPIKHKGTAVAVQDDESSQQFACLLPEYASAVILSDAYFRSIQQQYPFLHEPTFRRWELDILKPGKQIDQSDYLPLFFLYAVSSI